MFGILKLVIVICLLFVFCYLIFSDTSNHQLVASCCLKMAHWDLIGVLIQAAPFNQPLDVLRIGYPLVAGHFFFMGFDKLR